MAGCSFSSEEEGIMTFALDAVAIWAKVEVRSLDEPVKGEKLEAYIETPPVPPAHDHPPSRITGL